MEQVLSVVTTFAWVMAALAIALVCWCYRGKVQVPRLVAKRWAETKVRESGPISEEDLKALASMNSRLLDDALALRFAQTHQSNNPAN